MIEKLNPHELNHEKVKKHFEGNPEFLNTFSVLLKTKNNDEVYLPLSVYKVEKPNREKGHKDFLMLEYVREDTPEESYLCVRGMDKEEINPYLQQKGILCLKCKNVIFSMQVHDFHSCSCGHATVDGGRHYLHYSGTDIAIVNIDFLNNTYEIIKPVNISTQEVDPSQEITKYIHNNVTQSKMCNVKDFLDKLILLFNGNLTEIETWLNTRQEVWLNLSPLDLIRLGRLEALDNLIKAELQDGGEVGGS